MTGSSTQRIKTVLLTIMESPRDVGGRLVATFVDSDGNILGLIQDRYTPLETR